MPTNTYVALDKQVLASNQGAITFTNIPQTYTDLRLVISGGFVDSGFTLGARVGNGSVDTGGNYSYQIARGSGSIVSSYAKSNMVFGAVMQQGGNNLNNVVTVDFLSYSNTTTNKTWVCRYGNAGEGTDFTVSTWRSTAAINTISIGECGDGGTGAFNYGNMLAGTTFSLYGIKAWEAEATPKATGGYVYSDSSYWYHAFPFSSAFVPNESITADILVVAGGGAAAVGGGGAGGVLAFASQSLTATSYTCTVGAGGTGASFAGTNGANSQFGALTASVGGGRGGTTTSSNYNGQDGGSGGGSGFSNANPYTQGTGGVATSGQGSNGGIGGTSGSTTSGGGGGGKGGTPSTATPGYGGAGGIGTNSVTNWGSLSSVLAVTALSTNGYIAGGGGGQGDFLGGTGGLGGGANGAAGGGVTKNGIVSTGSGGGGGYPAGGNGGSGVVIVRYAK